MKINFIATEGYMGVVYGLGEDNKVYKWNSHKAEWVIYED